MKRRSGNVSNSIGLDSLIQPKYTPKIPLDLTQQSVDIDRSSDGHHLVQGFDVFVP